jgi:hypothetical protein
VDKELKELDTMPSEDWVIPDNFTPTHMNKFASMSPQTETFVKLFNLLPSVYDKHASVPETKPQTKDTERERHQRRTPRNHTYESNRDTGSQGRGSFGGRGRSSGSNWAPKGNPY